MYAENENMTEHPLDDLDAGIRGVVLALRRHGVETVESCQGGAGHCFMEPTVRFAGDKTEGYRAVSVAFQSGFKVLELRRVWPIIDAELTGPYWDMTFCQSA